MTSLKGLEEYEERAEEAVQKEFLHFQRQDVLRSKYTPALSDLDRREALCLIMTIKEKRNGIFKGRGCAVARSRRGKIRPEDVTSPTVSTEVFAMSCAIDAKEGRVVATCDVPGTYLRCTMDELCSKECKWIST